MNKPVVGSSKLPAYDRSLALHKVGGNPGIADELLDLLVADLPQLAGSLRSACRELESEALREVAHRIHGAACCCGTPALKRAAMKLEQVATAGNRRLLKKAHDSLQYEIDRLLLEQGQPVSADQH